MTKAPTRAELLSTLRRLSQLQNWDQSAAKTLSAIAEILFGPHAGRSEERRDHSIYVAGFLYLDEASKRVDYQFFDETKGQGPGYTLRYLWKERGALGPFPPPDGSGAQEDAAAFIDSLFFVMRKYQSPWGESELCPNKLPEYLAWIPQSGEPRVDHDGVHLSANELRELYGWHYCPYGEVVFFLYLWRLLLWSSISFDGPNAEWCKALLDRDFNSILHDNCARLGTTSIWDSSFWKERTGFEHHLYEWTYTEDTKFGNPEIVRRGLDYFDVPPHDKTSIWSRELENLLISTTGAESYVAFQPVLRYAESALVAFSNPSYSLPILVSDLLKRALSLNPALRFAGNSVEEADLYLRTAAAVWVFTRIAREKTNCSWESALMLLHRHSRFPIIPYFYWNAIDRKPKTHAVVPIWRSWTRPVNAKLHLGEPLTPLEDSAVKPAQTSIVGLSVVALEPLKSDLQVERDNENFDNPYAVSLNSEDHERIQWIDEVLLRASLPQVDAHYYGDIERIRANQEGVTLQDSIHHDQRKPIQIIETLLENENIPQTDRIAYSRALVRTVLRKLQSYSAFAGTPYETKEWENEVSTRRSECWISQMINWSVLLAILRAALDENWSTELRSALFATSDANLWDILRERLLSYMMADLGPKGDYSFVDAKGRASVSVSYFGPDLMIPRSLSGAGGGPTMSRIYAGLSFAFDEIVLNTFRHQLIGNDLISQHPIRIVVKVSSVEPFEISILFSPAAAASRERVKRAIGLSSLDHVLKKMGFQSKHYKKLKVETEGSPTVERILPYFKPIGDPPWAREWGILGIPMAALESVVAENGANSAI